MYERVVAIRPEVSLLIVGDGPDRPTYESLCRQRGWGQVHFVGHVESKELPRYLALADLFVFPTLSDTFGAVLSEAMAAELPVLASVHAAATCDLVDDGVTGYRFDPRDPATGAETILKVLALPDCGRTEMGRAAYRRIRSTDIGPSADVMAWFLTSQLSEPSAAKERSWFPWFAR
jgi:glycosyltransferase involved in cell wall biosynthesis